MKQQKALLGLLGISIILASLFLQAITSTRVAAATQITARSLTLEAGTTDGGSKPGGTVKHLFGFTLHDTTDSLGSITFQYCTTAAPVSGGIGCVAPAGISTNAATLNAQSGATGFTTITPSSLDDAADGIKNVVTIGRASATNLVGVTPSTYELASMVNPSAANTTFFVRISTYSSTNGTGTALEAGTVAASTANPVVVQGTMPESLVFCTGDTIGTTNGVPDCTTATNNTVQFNQLFSPTSTAYATSQMAASTNAGSGYAITVNGTTLTSGANTISPIFTGSTPHSDKSKFGISQFGMNLVLNDGTAYVNAPNIPNSHNINPASGSGNYHGQPVPASGYDVNGFFQYNTGDTVANSATTGTDAQIYTVSYIVNVPGSQPAGTYTSTLTYICTPTF